jgi:hypothetical protein
MSALMVVTNDVSVVVFNGETNLRKATIERLLRKENGKLKLLSERYKWRE